MSRLHSPLQSKLPEHDEDNYDDDHIGPKKRVTKEELDRELDEFNEYIRNQINESENQQYLEEHKIYIKKLPCEQMIHLPPTMKNSDNKQKQPSKCCSHPYCQHKE